MNRDGRLAIALLAPVLLGAVFALVRFVFESFDVPRDDDYEAAAKILEKYQFSVTNRDAVAVLPPWSLRAHVHLRGKSPIPADVIAPYVPDRYRRIFLWVEPDASEWLDRWQTILPAPMVDEDVGRIRVLGFDLGAPALRYDFREQIRDGEMWLHDLRTQNTIRCDQARNNGWACPGRPDWQRVTREWRLATENGVDALWVHPPKAEESLELRWPKVPMGERLVLQTGHTRKGATRGQAPVEVEVWVDGGKVASFQRKPEFFYRTQVIDTSAWKGQSVEVSFRFSSKNNGSNHFVFDAWTADASQPGGAR